MTLRLLVLAGDNWPRFDGWATARGLDAGGMPLPRFCHLVGFWATEGAQSEADVKKFEAALWRPPVGVVPTRGPWSPGEENRAFASLKAALGKQRTG